MDLDGDGHTDLLSGSYSRQSQDMAGLFQVLWGQEGGGFAEAKVLNGVDGEPLIIEAGEGDEYGLDPICTRPFAIDWTGDGHLDLVVGNFGGTLYLFEGQGQGKFAATSNQLLTDGAPLLVPGMHSDPFCVDWDQDGDLDILSGSAEGGIHWSENVAEEGHAPKMTEFKTLIEAGEEREYGAFLAEAELTGPSADARIWVEDVNGDGKLDLLVGDAVDLVGPAEGLSQEECRKRMAEWEAESEQYYEAMSGLGDSDEDMEAMDAIYAKLEAHYEKRAEFVTEESTGFVWQYIRK